MHTIWFCPNSSATAQRIKGCRISRKAVPLDPKILRDRYEKELRPKPDGERKLARRHSRDVDRFLFFNPRVRGPDPISAIGSAFLNYRLIRSSFGKFFTLWIFDFLPEDPLFEKQIKISRTDLYERVWTTPLRTLAKEFGLSDVGLAKLCRRHGIPLPGRGYWVRMQFGKSRNGPPCQMQKMQLPRQSSSLPRSLDHTRKTSRQGRRVY